ncbi:MAG: helix-turn-helix domain-containing protein [Eubacteriaceae bacterium]|nr:helix-turn-helix domain-containing protein [Eubacteriaceae bacterium]
MNFGAYLRDLRSRAGLTQRDLMNLSGISNAEISRIESGDRQKPSPVVLKALAPHIRVSYEDLMEAAGYIEQVIERGSFEDVVWSDTLGVTVDTFRRQVKHIVEKDPELISILDRAVDNTSEQDIETVKKLLTGFMAGNLNDGQKEAIRQVIDSFTKK